MDVLVRLEARPSDSPVLAHVNSIPVLPFGTRSRREVVTLYGNADANSLALAIAATIECGLLEAPKFGVVRHLGVWPGRGAVGDSAWRDAPQRAAWLHKISIFPCSPSRHALRSCWVNADRCCAGSLLGWRCQTGRKGPIVR